MPKKLLATTIILLIAITMLPLTPVSRGNFVPPTSPEIIILEPKRQNVILYEDTPIPIIVTITEPENVSHYHQITNITYSIDGKTAVEITNITKKTNQPYFSGTATQYHAYATINTIEKGSHLLTVYALDDAGNRLPTKTGFAYQSIDKYPNVTIFSPLNTTYFNTTKFTLNFTAENFIIGSYSWDGIDHVFYSAQNGTLHSSSRLNDGEHTLLLRVFTEFGWFSQTIKFAVYGADFHVHYQNLPLTPSRETSDRSPVPIVLIIVVAVVVFSIVGLLVFLRRKGINEAK
jgi:hypothetical protein